MKITIEQLDAIKELFNMGVGRGASILSQMVDSRVHLEVPKVEIFPSSDIEGLKTSIGLNESSSVNMTFSGSFDGNVSLLIPPDSATILVAALTNEEPGPMQLDPVRAGTLCEVGNMIINGLMGSITNVLKKSIDYGLPQYTEGELDNILDLQSDGEDTNICIATTTMNIENLEVCGKLLVVFKVGYLQELLSAIDAI